MSDCKDRYRFFVDPVSDNIAAVSKVDEPFPEHIGKFVDHPAEAGMRAENLHTLSNCFTGPLGSIRALWLQKFT